MTYVEEFYLFKPSHINIKINYDDTVKGLCLNKDFTSDLFRFVEVD